MDWRSEEFKPDKLGCFGPAVHASNCRRRHRLYAAGPSLYLGWEHAASMDCRSDDVKLDKSGCLEPAVHATSCRCRHWSYAAGPSLYFACEHAASMDWRSEEVKPDKSGCLDDDGRVSAGGMGVSTVEFDACWVSTSTSVPSAQP